MRGLKRSSPLLQQRKSILEADLELFKSTFNTRYCRIMFGHINLDLDDFCVDVQIYMEDQQKYYRVKCVAFDMNIDVPDIEFETPYISVIKEVIDSHRDQFHPSIDPNLIYDQDYFDVYSSTPTTAATTTPATTTTVATTLASTLYTVSSAALSAASSAALYVASAII